MNEQEQKELILAANLKLHEAVALFNKTFVMKEISNEWKEGLDKNFKLLKQYLNILAFEHGDIKGSEMRNENNI